MKKFLFTSFALFLGAGDFAVACSDQVCSSAVEVQQQVAAPALAVQSLAVPNVAVLAARQSLRRPQFWRHQPLLRQLL